MTARYTGRMWKDGDTIRWELRDAWNWAITGTAVRQPDGSYTLDGVVGEPPEALRLPLVDGVG